MYYELLDAGNGEFEERIKRDFYRFRSKRLKEVIVALHRAQRRIISVNLELLLARMKEWRQRDPKEYKNRGSVFGAGYRLWMEAKQGLRNLVGKNYDIQMPPPREPPASQYPGDTVNGVYVPQGGGSEVCHGFTFRWAVAAGKLGAEPAVTKSRAHNGDNMIGRLFPGNLSQYPLARENGILRVRPGDLIGMFENHRRLTHSMVVEDPHYNWFGANNLGAFGLDGVAASRGGRSTRTRVNIHALHHRWHDDNSTWRRVQDGGRVVVRYRRLP